MRRLRHGPEKLANTSMANEPNAANVAVCGCWMTLSAIANTAGITIAGRAAAFSEVSPGSAIRSRGILICLPG